MVNPEIGGMLGQKLKAKLRNANGRILRTHVCIFVNIKMNSSAFITILVPLPKLVSRNLSPIVHLRE